MEKFIEALRQKAFESFPGAGYNGYREAQEGLPQAGKLFYEVNLPENPSWEMLHDRIYPLFVCHLKAKSINPEQAQNTVVPVFYDCMCFLLEGKTFLDIFREIEGLSAEDFHARVLGWLGKETR
jgi:hypothetical protein